MTPRSLLPQINSTEYGSPKRIKSQMILQGSASNLLSSSSNVFRTNDLIKTAKTVLKNEKRESSALVHSEYRFSIFLSSTSEFLEFHYEWLLKEKIHWLEYRLLLNGWLIIFSVLVHDLLSLSLSTFVTNETHTIIFYLGREEPLLFKRPGYSNEISILRSQFDYSSQGCQSLKICLMIEMKLQFVHF